jgi:acetate kinase
MGLTPLSGMPGATRAGDVDPSLIFHYTSEPLSRLSYDSATTKEIHVTRVCSSFSYSFSLITAMV